jgi:peptide/nickel transport system permease protein
VSSSALREAGWHVTRRASEALFTVASAAVITFALLALAPGDPLATMLDGREVGPEAVARLRAVYALDGSPIERFLRWSSAFVRGDLGWSISGQRPVRDVLGDALPHSLLLCGLAVLLSLALGSALGAWQGATANRRSERVASLATIALFAVPEFLLALLLLVVFAWKLRWFPASGAADDLAHYLPWRAQLGDRLRHLVLPVTALSLVGIAIVSRYQRASMRAAMTEPFVHVARARGASTRRVLIRHVWRAALLPIVTLAGLYLPALVGGAVFVERAFSWPGIGNALANAVLERDVPVVMAIVVIGSAATAIGALLADLMAPLVDPRVRNA